MNFTLSVIIPCFNEVSTIEQVIDAVKLAPIRSIEIKSLSWMIARPMAPVKYYAAANLAFIKCCTTLSILEKERH